MAVVETSDFWSRGDCLNKLHRRQKALLKAASPRAHGREGRGDRL